MTRGSSSQQRQADDGGNQVRPGPPKPTSRPVDDVDINVAASKPKPQKSTGNATDTSTLQHMKYEELLAKRSAINKQLSELMKSFTPSDDDNSHAQTQVSRNTCDGDDDSKLGSAGCTVIDEDAYYTAQEEHDEDEYCSAQEEHDDDKFDDDERSTPAETSPGKKVALSGVKSVPAVHLSVKKAAVAKPTPKPTLKPTQKSTRKAKAIMSNPAKLLDRAEAIAKSKAAYPSGVRLIEPNAMTHASVLAGYLGLENTSDLTEVFAALENIFTSMVDLRSSGYHIPMVTSKFQVQTRSIFNTIVDEQSSSVQELMEIQHFVLDDSCFRSWNKDQTSFIPALYVGMLVVAMATVDQKLNAAQAKTPDADDGPRYLGVPLETWHRAYCLWKFWYGSVRIGKKIPANQQAAQVRYLELSTSEPGEKGSTQTQYSKNSMDDDDEDSKVIKQEDETKILAFKSTPKKVFDV